MKEAEQGIAIKSAFLWSQMQIPHPFEETYSFGIDTTRFQNLAAVTTNTLLFASGNVVRAFELDQEEVLTIENDAAGGVTCLSQSPDKRLLAVAYSNVEGAYIKVFTILRDTLSHESGGEKTIELPDCALQLLLRIDIPQASSQGTMQITTTISAMDFNTGGQLLACVTAAPDFGLYIFNAENGALSLKSKAFTAPIMRLEFNRYTASSLTSGGKGHVKFWRMAETFTGSKLKGDLGKFGALPQSDVTGFVELPCGSYLTGCGDGEIALWESVNVRLVFRRNQSENCHDGAVSVLEIDASGLWSANNAELQKRLELAGAPGPNDGWWDIEGDDIRQSENRPIPSLISAGEDGYIKIWSAHQIMQSQYVESDSASLFYEIEPAEEIFLGQNVCVRDIVYSFDQRTAFIVDSGSGGFIALSIENRQTRRLEFGHAGPVKSICLANSLTSLEPVNDNSNRSKVRSSFAASVGTSGVVFIHDLVSGRLIQVKPAVQTQATKCIFIHENLCLVVGYADGSVRFYSLLPNDTEGDEFCYLIAVYRCFNTAIIDIACSETGVVLVLNSSGEAFFFATSLRLVRKEEKSESADVSGLELNQMQQSLVNVVLDTQNFDEESRAAAELARRNARGRLGMCEKDVRPVFELNCRKLAFGDAHRQLRFPFWLDGSHFAFAVSGNVDESARIVIFTCPATQLVDHYRSSHPEQVLESTLFGEVEHSMVSFDVSELVRADDIKTVNVHVPPAPLPAGCEGTVAKIEQEVMQARIQAMLPSKSALENAMAALEEMDEEEESASGEPSQDEISLLLSRASGVSAALNVPNSPSGPSGPNALNSQKGQTPQKLKKKKKSANDPLAEDADESIEYDFQQFNVTSADGFTTTTASEGVQLEVLLEVCVDRDVRCRADNAMDALRARAEAAQQNISIAPGPDDPATAMAALAVAELRAAYRSSLLYCFSLISLQEFALSGEKTLILSPAAVAAVALPQRLISARILTESELDDDECIIENISKVGILVKKPIRAFAFEVKRISEFCAGAAEKAALAQFCEQIEAPAGAICAILEGGDLVLEIFGSPQEFALLQQKSGLQPPRMVFSLAQLQQPLCQLEIGCGGHLVCAGDALGNFYALQTAVFQRFTQLVEEEELKFCKEKCYYMYEEDETWSTGSGAIQLSKFVDFHEEVYALLPRASKVDKNAQNQAVIEVADVLGGETLEELRLRSLDNAENLKGVQSQAGVQAKVDSLKSRYLLLLKENEAQPVGRRLAAAEIEPDLQPRQAFLAREEARAFDLMQNDVGTVMNATLKRISAVRAAFPVLQRVLRVYQFSTAGASVCSFKLTALPEDFEASLCRALNIASLDELDELRDDIASECSDTVTASEAPELTQQVVQQADFSEAAEETRSRRPRTLRPVDKVVRQLLAEKEGKEFIADGGADEFNMRKERIEKRAQARDARRAKFQQLIDSRPSPSQIHPDDEQTIQFAKQTFGEFPLKMQDDYIAIMQRIQEQQSTLMKNGAQEAVEVNPEENREGKWREFLLTIKGLQDAKKEFNTRVRVLFAHKQAVVAVSEIFRQKMLQITAEIKAITGQQLAAELDAFEADFIQPDFVTAFVKLNDAELQYIVEQKMEAAFDEFSKQELEREEKLRQVRESELVNEEEIEGQKGAENHPDALQESEEVLKAREIDFENLQIEVGQILRNSKELSDVAIEYINECLTSKQISPEEAGKLRTFLDAQAPPREALIQKSLETLEIEKVTEHQSDSSDAEGGSKPDSRDSSRAQEPEIRNEATGKDAQQPDIASIQSAIQEAVLDSDGQGVTVEQLESFDCGKLVSIFAKSQVPEHVVQQASHVVRILLFRRRLLFERITQLVEAFDECVLELVEEQLYLQADFARIRVRLINLFQECEIHHLYVTKDANSLKNLEKCKGDHYKLSLEMEEMQKQIMQKIEEARGVETALEALQAQFDELVQRDAPYRPKLLKLYCKRFKLPKVKNLADKEEENVQPGAEYEDDEESSSLSDGDSDNGDDEIIDETVPPEGCGQEIFEFVLALREKKRICDTELAAIEQAAEELRQQHATLEKREKGILTNIEAANRELTSFRSTKQKELNQVLTAALVSVAQICSLKDGAMQENYDQSLLFDEMELQRLFDRIARRKAELQGLSRIGQQLKQSYAQSLAREREEQAELEILNQKLMSVEQLKFGRVVDIAKLDGIAINEQAAELQKQVDIEEQQHQTELVVQDKQFDRQKDELKQMQKENTQLVQQLIQLEQDALELDRVILQGQKQPPKAWCSDNKEELIREEYNNLKQAIVDRERELRGLVDEISLLKNHGSQ